MSPVPGRAAAARAVPVLRRVGRHVGERGLAEVAGVVVRWLVQWVRGSLGTGRGATFRWDGRDVSYFHHRYHYTWLNERAVEVALARDVLAAGAPEGVAVLEVGNVTRHYLPVRHEVVDKYEDAAGVLNADVVDVAEVTGGRLFDLVISVSTLEHVGLDEAEQDPAKPGRAIAALKEVLAPGGLLWVTLPVGYNRALDARLREGDYGFDRVRALRRDPRRNVWREVPVEAVWDAPYDRLVYTAHGLVVAEFRRPAR